MTRTPIKVKRIPVTYYSDRDITVGGWAHFSKTGERPAYKIKDNERVLFCPYCGEWTIYKRHREDLGTWKCTGWCGWANTNDFFVKKENDLWGQITQLVRRKK